MDRTNGAGIVPPLGDVEGFDASSPDQACRYQCCADAAGRGRVRRDGGSTRAADSLRETVQDDGYRPDEEGRPRHSRKLKKLKKPENPGRLFGKTRPDRQKEDQERNFGEIVLISGYSATVVSAGFVQTVGEFEDAGYMKISVKICNRDEEAQAYGSIDWRLQTPGGQVIDPGFVVSAPTLTPRADLVEGGEVAGDVYFEIDGQRGDFYIIYKPDSFDASRGIWKVTA